MRLDLRDAFAFGGLALITAGAGWAYAPAAPIVLGLALFWLGTRRV